MPQPQPRTLPRPVTASIAILAIFLGLASMGCCIAQEFFPFEKDRTETEILIGNTLRAFAGWAAIIGIALGVIARLTIKTPTQHTSILKAAVTGFWTSMIALIIFFFAVVAGEFEQAAVRSLSSRVMADMRSMATTLESYWIDCESYPAWAVGAAGINASSGPEAPEFNFPTFRIRQSDKELIFMLTTPIAYMTDYPIDPLLDSRKGTFGYYSDNKGWILVSPGHDGEYEINPVLDYDSATTKPQQMLIIKSYDPTNGTPSQGDIYRIKT